MKILLIGNTASNLAKKLVKEAASQGLSFVAVRPRDIKISLTNNKFKAVLKSGQNLLNFDVFYFYAIGSNLAQLAELAKYLHSHNKSIVEASLIAGRLPLDKFDWRDQAILPTPDYKFFFHFSKNDYDKISYPVVVKEIDSSRGLGVFKATSKRQLQEIIKQTGRKIIIQKYLETDSDYRVLVVGNKALGTMHRFKSSDNLASNRSPEKIVKAELPEKVLEACVRASKAKGLEIAGVDLVKYKNKYYVWEINASPQCRLFEKYTGINAPAKILEYLKSKHRKNH